MALASRVPAKNHAQIQVIAVKDTQSMMSLSFISASFIVLPSPDAIYQSEVIFITVLLSEAVGTLPLLSVSKGTEVANEQKSSCSDKTGL